MRERDNYAGEFKYIINAEILKKLKIDSLVDWMNT